MSKKLKTMREIGRIIDEGKDVLDRLFDKIQDAQNEISELEEKVKILEDENQELRNQIYEHVENTNG